MSRRVYSVSFSLIKMYYIFLYYCIPVVAITIIFDDDALHSG